jgi:glycosyltransferase involved in cell wall biosynthesis
MYGGTERVVSWLTEELVRQGHDVTLFASGDSVTQARLVAVRPRSLRLDKECRDELPHLTLQLERVIQSSADFDLVHWHTDFLGFPLMRRMTTPNVSTLHGRLDLPDLVPLYRQFDDIPVVSISDAQRQPLPWINWQGTVYHGMPKDLLHFCPNRGDYLAFLGRISLEKRVDRAIEIAQRAGMPLKIAAKISNADYPYYVEEIKPLIESSSLVEFLGEIDEKDKQEFLGNAYSMLFPIDWPEPFGIVMIESMAVGTPIIAFPGGSVSEVMVEGQSGYVVTDLDQAVRAVEKIAQLDRHKCRAVFEERYTDKHMADAYLKIYARLIQEHRESLRLPRLVSRDIDGHHKTIPQDTRVNTSE